MFLAQTPLSRARCHFTTSFARAVSGAFDRMSPKVVEIACPGESRRKKFQWLRKAKYRAVGRYWLSNPVEEVASPSNREISVRGIEVGGHALDQLHGEIDLVWRQFFADRQAQLVHRPDF
jgi:hypothetical protein